ncbi:MAG: Spy/CpxP family protein refolding chaperone, partial [Acidobacteriota bacterium]|nr:Spy/CpxP family protein refolding chaperone [Acidobacteriota bacterium]
MTQTLKFSLAAGFVAVVLAAGSTLVTAQDGQMKRRGPGQGPGVGGPPPDGMRGPGGPRGPMGMGNGPGFRELDLTDDQKAQVKAIGESHRAEFKAAGEKMRAARQGMRALIAADTLDEAAVRAKSIEVAAAEADLAILNAKVRTQTMQVLTSEQLAKLKERQAQRPSQPRKQRQQGPR